ncbi:MAG: hypothetical protein ACRDBT_09070 [Aeromonas sp.]
MSQPNIRPQDSIVGGLINGIINGLIAHWHFKEYDTIPLSVNSISNTQISVWGEAVSLTFGLGIIISLIAATLFTKHLHKEMPSTKATFNPRFMRDLIPTALLQSVTLFGWFIALAVMWTKYMGEITVPNHFAAMLVGGFACVITIIIEYKTKQSLIFKKVSVFS